MDSFFSIDSILLFCIALSALLIFLHNKASHNSFILLIQASMIGFYLFVSKKISIINASVILLLMLFCLITMTANIYIEKSIQTPRRSASKLNIIIGCFILLFFTVKSLRFKPVNTRQIITDYSFFGQDLSALIFAFFTFFSILISSFLILRIKNTD